MSGENRHTGWRIFLFAGIVTAFFYALIVETMPKYTKPSTPEELAAADLSREYVCLGASHAEVYPGRLYERADFSGKTPDSGDPGAKYETCRIVLLLEPGITYGITGQTATYAQRVYVNGELLQETGTVSDSPDQFVPRTDFYTVYFTPQQAETEIIVQHAWFNHAHGALHKLYLAQQQVITRTDRAQTLCDGLIVGTLLSMSIFFFGMFLFHTSNRGMLWFSLSGLCAAGSYLIYESKQIMTFFPDLNWYVGHKVELLSNIYYFLFVALFAYAALKERPSAGGCICGGLVVTALTLFYVVAPSTFYSYYTVPVGGFIMLCELVVSVALLRRAARDGKLHQPDQLFVCLSPMLTLLVYLIEGVTYFSRVFYLRGYLMILLAFGNALVLTHSYTRTERRLSLAKQRELEIAEENAMLEKMNHLKSDFMRNLAHEMKTPLTVMSGYAQLTERQIQKNAVNEETTGNLETIAREAGRLSDMVTRLLDVTYQQVEERKTAAIAPDGLLEDAAAVLRPILLKNRNRLEIACETGLQISANQEALLQVLINLAINSNKHTEDGVIRIVAEDTGDGSRVAFLVSDSGSGIREEDLPHIFERGYSKDGGSGLGLTICREIIVSAGGRISVEKTGENGTTIRFTVPAKKEEA